MYRNSVKMGIVKLSIPNGDRSSTSVAAGATINARIIALNKSFCSPVIYKYIPTENVVARSIAKLPEKVFLFPHTVKGI